jgi:hypothetical protein
MYTVELFLIGAILLEEFGGCSFQYVEEKIRHENADNYTNNSLLNTLL